MRLRTRLADLTPDAMDRVFPLSAMRRGGQGERLPSRLRIFPRVLRAEKLGVMAALTAILVVALALRFYGLDWDRGYGYTPHPDERAILMKVAELSPPGLGQLGTLFIADESTWNPRWFPYGSFPLYLLKGVQLLSSALLGIELNDLRVAGRTISALADVGTVAAVYLLGSRMYGRREGLLASALVALAVIHIQLSHFYAVDTLLGLWTVVALYFMYRVAREGRLRDSLLAGVFVGLGVATKVSQAPIYLALVMAHLLFVLSPVLGPGNQGEVGARFRSAVKGLASGIAASILVLVVVQPYAFLDWSRFLGDVVEQSEMVRRIRDYPYTRQYIDTTPYWYQVRQLSTWGLGWPLGALAWGGLLYVSLRGMRLGTALIYLGLGWALPMAVVLASTSFLAIVLASGIVFVALLGSLPFRSPDSRFDVLLLSWVAPYFLITGAFQVKFLRYLLPITPVLLLLGSRTMVAFWDAARTRRPALRPWLAVGLVAVLGSAAAYAVSYMAVYSQPHTAVRTAQWINEQAPRGAVILKEHWEEGLPGLEQYVVRDLPLYDPDGPEKVQRLSESLSEADYVLFFSNRLYGTIPRLPERYPFTTGYYRLLFSGGVGYELVNVEAAYPRLAGVSLVDDTFGRPGIPRPEAMRSQGSPGQELRLGFADESFSVYDHPLGLVFQNVGRWDAKTIQQTIEGAVPDGAPATIGAPVYTPKDAEVQRRGGTWTDIVRAGSWANRFPIAAWLLFVELVALLALPVTFVLFRPLPDRGYLFSKALGLLVVALAVWLLASLHWVAFSRESIWSGLALLTAMSTVVLARHRGELVGFVRRRWRVIVGGEAVFLAAFSLFVLVRMANPDLWHPFLGGEKPMEMAYLTAVLKSSFMPPYDPWFSGGYLNYYYWGYQVVATVIKATGIEPVVAFNLAVALFFALTVAGAYSIVYNLAEGTRRVVAPDGLGRARWSPALAGLGGGFFVAVLGNLDGAIQVGQGVWRAGILRQPFGEFDFWRSSRMMPPDPPGHEITEFPFFTFLFGDLHAHMMAIPYALLALGLALSVVLAAKGAGKAGSGWSLGDVVRVAVLGIVVGALRLINTWDYPTYMLVAVAAVFLAAYFRHGGLGLMVMVETAAKSALVFAVGFVVFLPYHLAYQAPYDGLSSVLKATSNQTVLWQFLAIHGLFVFIVGSFFVAESRPWLRAWWRVVRVRATAMPGLGGSIPTKGTSRLRVAGLAVAALVAGYIASVAISGWLGSSVPFLVVMAALVLVIGLGYVRSSRGDAHYLSFVAAIVVVALALAIGLDVFAVDGDRMNSVFKFYLQIWVMLALASAYLLWRMVLLRGAVLRSPTWGARLWLGTLVVLVVSAAVYPLLGTQDRLRVRFNDRALPMTLDGTAYIQGTLYQDRNGQIDLAADYEGIRWLRDQVEGSPVVLEASMPAKYHYRAWNGRVSVYTGLPGVVGWQVHQEQQRRGYAPEVVRRILDIDRIYSTTDSSEAVELMRKYGVEYVYLGQVERLYYPADGLRKFEGEMEDHLDAVYRSDKVNIYRVRGRGGPDAARARPR